MTKPVTTGVSRRGFVARASLLGAAATVVPGVVSLLRCGSGREEVLAEAATYATDLDCTDTAGLLPVDLRLREDNEYVDRSPHETRYCFNCSNFRKPRTEGDCAACLTVKGPIHPLGWCRTWTEARR
jgi:hypothetical protein